MTRIAFPEDIAAGDPIGGKAEGLLRLTRASLPVPPWFVVLPDGPSTTGPDCGISVDDDVARKLGAAAAILSPNGEALAVRSSAVGEDSGSISYAGQFETRLGVLPGHLAEEVARVARSADAARVAAYRSRMAAAGSAGGVAVVVQRLLEPEVSGVTFSADPVSARRGVAVVAALRGRGDMLVSGLADAETWHVDRDEILTPLNLRPTPTLAPGEIRAAARLGREAQRLFGRPQDIEWCLAAGRLYVLQSRAITTLRGRRDPDAPPSVWDCSNIAENYDGVTTALTASFARMIYECAFRAFCAELGVGPVRVERHARAFRGLIGVIRGRLYYNLGHWYEVLGLLPGFRWNSAYLEAMLGIREHLPAAALPPQASRTEHWLAVANLPGVALRSLTAYAGLSRRVRRFQRDVDALLTEASADLALMRLDELAARYRAVEAALYAHAATPTINDLWVMVGHGFARRLAQAWCGEAAERICDEGVVLEGATIHREMSDAMVELAGLAGRSLPFCQALAEAPQWRIVQLMPEAPGFAAALDSYIERFGDRVPGELKLETVTLREDPLPLLRSVAALALRLRDGPPSKPPITPHLGAAVPGHPLRSWLLARVLAQTRARLADREALRFTRARIFGLARRLLREIGSRLWALDLLETPADILHLELDEVLAFVEGRAVSSDLRALAAARRAEYHAYAAEPPPPTRFATTDLPSLASLAATDQLCDPAGNTRRGLGCSPGRATGRVRRVAHSTIAPVAADDIIVTLRTDPGWITLLPACAGLVVEIGNPLSHSAIIARELAIPMIVTLPGATTWLRDGDLVTIDGGTGTVIRHAGPEDA